MKTVGTSEVKTRLGELLKRVSEGESIRITRRGIAVARLVPTEESAPKDLKKVVREIHEIREGASLGDLKMRKLINERRRY
jgi:prevent-host-death family protein